MFARAFSMIAVAAMLSLGACATQQAASGDKYAKAGFFTAVKENRLWVFKNGSKGLAEFQSKGEPAQQVTRIAAGPGGITIKSDDSKTIDEYLAAK